MATLVEKLRLLIIKEDKEGFYPNHLILVRNYALELAKLENETDLESIEIAALTHDLGRMRHGGHEHNLTGAKDVKLILEKENYPSKKINLICEAIISHGGKKEFPVQNHFGEIIRSADALSRLDTVPLTLSMNLKKLNYELKPAIEKTLKKLNKSWENKITLDSAKKIGLKKYEAAKLLLESNLKLLA